MAIQERKEREKEQFKKEVIKAAYRLIRQGGIEALTLRKLASLLEYSTTKLYHEFGEKEAIVTLVAEDICQRQNCLLEKVPAELTAEERLLWVTHEAICFYVEEPSSSEVLLAIRFKGFKIPPAFQLAADRFRATLAALQLPALQTESALDDALMVCRALTLGALSIMRQNSDESQKKLVIKIVDDGIRLLIAGWKSTSIRQLKTPNRRNFLGQNHF